MKFAVILATVVSLVLCWLPSGVLAEDPAMTMVEQNLAVAYQPPQASAEALLTLPTVYVLPGSFLYWFKHTYEQLRLMVESDPQKRTALLLQFSQQRLAEGYQALQKQDWSVAKQSFANYQQDQKAASQQLNALQANKKDVNSLLDVLRLQLGVQKALDAYNQQQAPKDESKDISALLRIRPEQTLALSTAEGGAMLGAEDVRQASSSAQAITSATPSATPSP
jgi:hypothetical protein